MDIVRLAIARPVGVAVACLLLTMFGLIGLGAIPIQLTPTIDTPLITVETSWPGRSPQEVVDEITREQEERLKNVENLEKMISTSREGGASIVLEFKIGTDIGDARQEISDALRQVPSYPEDVDEPTIISSGAGPENAIAWIILDVDPEHVERFPNFDIGTLFTPLDEEVKPYLERTEGVAEVDIFGGREQEVRVLVDQVAIAQRGVTHLDVIQALRGENTNVSAGTISEGKRDTRVRVMGQFDDPEQVLGTIVAYRESGPVYVRDVATVEVGHQKVRGFVRSLGHPAIAMPVMRQTGANVVQVMDELKQKLDEVRENIIPNLDPEVGPYLRLRQVYDETIYIESSIGLVTQNLYVGGGIAALVLLAFLRSVRSTGIVALAIPISVIGTFLVMLGLGRTLNIISLAGLAFAVGMVVDNAIVVLENIYRKLQEGRSPMQAAYEGGREVWGAILASTLTTVAVFVPIITVQEEAGQLFRDIAIAIVASVTLSLIISITVIPAASSRWLNARSATSSRKGLRGLFGMDRLFGSLVSGLGSAIAWLCSGWRAHTLRPLTIALMTAGSLIGASVLQPPMDYLPAGNRNLVFGGLRIPPGLSIAEQTRIAEIVEARVAPYMLVDASDPDAIAALPEIPMNPFGPPGGPSFKPVAIDNIFVGAFDGGMFSGATSADPQVVLPIGAMLTKSMNDIPDTSGGARQSSIFGRGFGGGTSVDVEVSGPDLDRVIAAAQAILHGAFGHEDYGQSRVSPEPSNFDVSQTELHVRLNSLARELGFRTDAVGVAVSGLFDGAFVDDYFLEGDTVDLVVLPELGRLETLEALGEVPIASPAGPIIPIDSIVDASGANGPQVIRRIEELPSVTVSIEPPPGMPVERAQQQIEELFVAPLRLPGADGTQPLIDRTMRVRLDGTAASLNKVQGALFGAGDSEQEARSDLQNAGLVIASVVAAGFLGLGAWVLTRTGMSRRPAYAFAAAVGLGVILASLFASVSLQPQLTTARFVWALVVTYLLMAALFESFVYPMVIMFAVPLAVVGGFVGLNIVHDITEKNPVIATQNLDVLTMLGFVILIGVVVNNAILLVHQALNFMQAENGKLDATQAIAQSVRTRVRPIFMSTMTSIGGMLPLVLFPGAGSEMYRGLGSVVVGGLLVSTVFTLVLVPLMFSLTLDMTRALSAALSSKDRSEQAKPALPA